MLPHVPVAGRALQAAFTSWTSSKRCSPRAARNGINLARLRSALRLCACATLPLLLTACHWAVLDPRGPVGQADRTILIDSLAIMLAIGVPTIIATFAFAWWFRASNTRARYRPDWEFSGAIELVVWAIPAMVIILLGGVAWIGSHELDPAKPLSDREAPLDVQVVSLDWKWLFIYPQEGVASVNQLVVPAGVPLRFSLTSASVWNVFFVPQLGSMIYTMNGMRTQMNLQADEIGTLPRPVGALQWRWLLRHALPGPRRARRRVRRLGQGDARSRPDARWRHLHGARAAEREPAAFDVRRGDAGAFRAGGATGAAARPRAGDRAWRRRRRHPKHPRKGH